MAIVNRTPDSFYDRGRTYELDRAVAGVEKAVAEGADWVDIGGVPFSPLAGEVSVAEELRRVLPVIEAVRASTDAVISVDTFRAEVARQTLAAGADAINDTSGLRDPALAEAVAEAEATIVIAHSKAPPREWYPSPSYVDVVGEVREFLAARAARAEETGIAHDKIIIDPGHDLNKNTYHSLELTRRLPELADLGFPLLVSVSNKDFIGETLGLPVDQLTEGTIAAVVLCIVQGARIVRVHDVRATVAAVQVTEAVLGWRTPKAPRHNLV